MSENQFGLTRSIPEDIKLEIRRRCGFGCVICGSTITNYEHFSPDFKYAAKHDPDGIALLCPTHHLQVTKGIIPKEQVAEAYAAPAALQAGFASENHPYFKGTPTLELGDACSFQNVDIPIMVRGRPLFSFGHTRDEDEIAKISIEFSDSIGSSMLSVVENEWRVMSQNWNFVSIANRYVITGADRVSQMTLKFFAPNRIRIDEALVFFDGVPFEIGQGRASFGNTTVSGNCVFAEAYVGVHFA